MSNSVPKYHLQHINFIGSFPSVEKTPPSRLPEFAFVGRSNVGKSSLINYLCDRKKLAKTSNTPGKTQFINLFQIEQDWLLADLPGYGYARISKKKRAAWEKMIENYLLRRENLFNVFQLIDVRLEPQPLDLKQIDWMGQNRIPFSIVFTKSDKVKPKELTSNIEDFKKELSKTWENLPPIFVTSSSLRRGREELLEYIHQIVTESKT